MWKHHVYYIYYCKVPIIHSLFNFNLPLYIPCKPLDELHSSWANVINKYIRLKKKKKKSVEMRLLVCHLKVNQSVTNATSFQT